MMMILKRKIKNKDPTLVYNHCSQNKNKNFGKKKTSFQFLFSKPICKLTKTCQKKSKVPNL